MLEREQRPDVLEVLLGHLAGVDAILVLEKRVEEAVDVLHHALRRLPRNVNLALGAIVQQVDARAGHVVDARGRRLEILELTQVLLVDRVERRCRSEEGWLGRLEVLLDRGFHRQDLGLLLGGGVGDDVGARRLGAGLLLLRLELGHHHVHGLDLLLHLDRLHLELLLQQADRRGRRLELIHAVHVARDHRLSLGAPHVEHRAVE